MGKPESSQTRLLGQEKNLPSFQILKNMAKSLQPNSDLMMVQEEKSGGHQS